MKYKLVIPAAIVTFISFSAIASHLVPIDPGTVNALSTTAENCFPEANGRTAWSICNMEAAGGIDIRYRLIPWGDTSTVVTTASGIELKPGACDAYPIGGEKAPTGRVSCISESGTPNVNTWAY